jgi:hypothetical protein
VYLAEHRSSPGVVPGADSQHRADPRRRAYLLMNRFEAIRPYTSPADVYDIVRREFNAAYTEGGIFQLTMHPHVTGYRSRIWTLGGRTWVPLVRVLHEWAELRHAQGYPFRLSNSYHPRA